MHLGVGMSGQTIVYISKNHGHNVAKSFFLFAILCVSIPTFAQENSSTLSETNSSNNAVSTSELVADKEKSIAFLKANPAQLEKTISHLILVQDAQGLRDLIPVYQEYPQRDESLIDWGNAIIAKSEGKLADSIKLYRKVNAVLPDIRLLRFQLAYALYLDKQYKAAKSELEKLRSVLTNPAEINQINEYIKQIDSNDKWNFNFNLNFLDDNNLTNASPVGTKLTNGPIPLENTQPHEEGQGLGYSVGAEKKWALSDRFFTAVHTNLYGKYYWDNKKFNDLYANIGLGLGYQNATNEIEVYPSFTQGFYGGGTSRKEDSGDLKRYSENKALNLSLNHWFNPKLMYQNFSQYGMLRYEGNTAVNNIDTTLLSNTLVYLPKQTRSFFGGVDYLKGDNAEGYKGDSYNRWGLRLGWSEAWNHGISTRVNLGYGQKDYDAPQDFIGIQRENKEYDLGLSIWKRDFTLFKLTPRLSWNYHKVTSNSAFEEYSKNNVNLEFTQTF